MGLTVRCPRSSPLLLLCVCLLVHWTSCNIVPEDAITMMGNQEKMQHVVIDASGEVSGGTKDEVVKPDLTPDVIVDTGELPPPTLTGKLKVVYCASPRTKPYYEYFLKQAKESFPELTIEGAEYPLVALIVNLLRVAQGIGVVWMVWGGEPLLRALGFRILPKFYYRIQKNGVYISIFIYIVLPHMLKKVWQHGPFMVYLNDEEVINTLVSYTPPDFEEVQKALYRHAQ